MQGFVLAPVPARPGILTYSTASGDIMEISFRFKEKNNLIYYAVFLGIGILLTVLAQASFRPLVLFAILYFFICSMRVRLSDKLPWLWTGILFGVGSIFTTYCIQYCILDPQSFEKTSDRTLFLNVLCVAFVYFICHLIFTRKPGRAAALAHCFLVAVSFTDYFVYLFRENELSFNDLTSTGTGLSVLAHYRLQLHVRGVYVILGSILFLAVIRRCDITFQKAAMHRVIDLAVLAVLFFYVQGAAENRETQTWELKGSYQNGFMLNYYLGVRDSFVSAPDDYDIEKVKELEQTYGSDSSGSGSEKTTDDADSSDAGADGSQITSTLDSGKKPVIITIMDESFADLSTVGEFETNQEATPFIDSLKENTIRGYALSSVYGAKTPNSEWEYMTGNSMAWLPSGSVVYEQYLQKNPFSMVSTLNAGGYTTIAMHPYYSTGWKRNTNYPKLGFDEQYFMDDGYFDETNIVRDYITDQELFDKIINRYEQKGEDENLFIMGITMQNHGGYEDYYSNFNSDEVTAEGGRFNDVDQYLSLINETDNAVKNLITYFQSVDQPVEIIFFGDHQPSLDSWFYYTLNGKGMSGLTMDEMENFYKVPFFIWTNWDSQEREISCTSLNYLSTMALQVAGIDLPAYNKFLAEMREHIPAINSRGYYSISQQKFLHFEDAVGEEKEWLDNYQMLQYNCMFDKKHRSSVFFPYHDSAGNLVE